MRSNIETFYYWMNERQRIFLNKEEGKPWPWTEDAILQKYSFCNVFRMQDRVTKWLFENWYEPYAEHENLFFAACMARQINWPPTLEKIGYPEDWDVVLMEEKINAMELMKLRDEKVYTGAYMLCGGAAAGISKPQFTMEKVLLPLWFGIRGQLLRDTNDQPIFPTTIEGTVTFLTKFQGFGGFLAYEVATDLRHTRYLRNAPDIYTWANPGPGANRGLNRIHGRELEWKIPLAQAVEEMQNLMEGYKIHRESWMPAIIEMRDVEHSCCEFDKYQRVALGQGRPRSTYRRDKELEY